MAVIIGAILCARSWADHVRDDAARDAAVKQKAEEISQSQAQITALQKQTAATLASKDAEIAKIRQDADAARAVLLSAYASAQKPAPHQVTAAEASAISKAPDAPSVHAGDLILDVDAQKNAAEYKLTCDKCSAQVSGYQAELNEKDRIISAKDEQLQAALKSSKGGAWYQRAWRVIEPIGCGAAGAGLGSLLGGPKGAVIGSGSAGLGCAIFGK